MNINWVDLAVFLVALAAVILVATNKFNALLAAVVLAVLLMAYYGIQDMIAAEIVYGVVVIVLFMRIFTHTIVEAVAKNDRS